MDFIVGLPRSRHGNDAIWFITDKLTKVAHFIPVKTTYTTQRLARLYLASIGDDSLRDSMQADDTGKIKSG